MYFAAGTWIINQAFYISNHVIWSLEKDKVNENIFIPWTLIGISIILISLVNLHYFKNIYQDK